jgi:ABC-type lipoprotein export system ATPase subunit
MSYYLHKAVISGLWGTRKALHIPLDRKVNFIIGKNGTGKTTVINILAAALTADFERLDRLPFSSIQITLATKGSRKRPSIEVIKQQKKDLPYFDISYKIRLSASEEATVYDLDALEEERIYRGAPQRILRERLLREKFLYIQPQLEDMVKVSWLSVHRITEAEKSPDDRRPPSVDSKLVAMNNALVRYFSKLATKFSEETKTFQKASFLSLTSIQKEANIRNFVDSVDIDAEKSSLASIFALLGVEERVYNKQVEQIAKELSNAKLPFLENQPISIQQLFAILNSFKAHALVQLYESLQAKKKDIFEPTEKFLRVINSLFAPRKRASISAQNELVIKNADDVKIEIEDLSSGEKQLLIIIGQALLQESSPVVYIADEPELSLHVEWQEKLTLSISELNPNAQIIFATHSPDIVGPYSDRIIDMEKALA